MLQLLEQTPLSFKRLLSFRPLIFNKRPRRLIDHLRYSRNVSELTEARSKCVPASTSYKNKKKSIIQTGVSKTKTSKTKTLRPKDPENSKTKTPKFPSISTKKENSKNYIILYLTVSEI